jgi:hypothetical protein
MGYLQYTDSLVPQELFMRRIARLLSVLAIVAAAGLTQASPAMAADAPWCESGASIFFCSTDGTSAASWTIYRHWGGSTVTVPGGIGSLRSSCQGGTLVRVNYNYYSGGVLVASPASQFLCNSGPWP